MKRALVSVTNKEGIVEFCKGLVELGFEIVSTGGTLKKLNEDAESILKDIDLKYWVLGGAKLNSFPKDENKEYEILLKKVVSRGIYPSSDRGERCSAPEFRLP